MRILTEILLGDLKLHHQRRIGHCTEQRMERLARLKVQRTVLHLNENVVAKRAVERFEFVVRLFDAVDGHGVAVDECAPHRDAAVRR